MSRSWETIVTRRPTPDRSSKRRSRFGASAWILSLAVHGAILAALGVTITRSPQGGSGGASGGGNIVLTGQFGGRSPSYLEEVTTSRFTLANAAPALIEIAPNPIPVPQPRPSEIAPASNSVPIPPEPPLAFQGYGSAGTASSRGQVGDGSAQTNVFGVPGQGTRFVYVFDRSASMEGSRLAAAKRELIASLYALESRHQFQIIFYSEQPHAMHLVRGGSVQMTLADERGKRLAEQFVRGVFADGPTHHLPALDLALRLRPNVIFFLTDADEPQMSADELSYVRQLNRNTVINTIEFGAGPPVATYNFLRQLAAENGGQHGYVDASLLTTAGSSTPAARYRAER
jgi:hypothetical protein